MVLLWSSLLSAVELFPKVISITLLLFSDIVFQIISLKIVINELRARLN